MRKDDYYVLHIYYLSNSQKESFNYFTRCLNLNFCVYVEQHPKPIFKAFSWLFQSRKTNICLLMHCGQPIGCIIQGAKFLSKKMQCNALQITQWSLVKFCRERENLKFFKTFSLYRFSKFELELIEKNLQVNEFIIDYFLRLFREFRLL